MIGLSVLGRLGAAPVAPERDLSPKRFEYSQIHMGVRVSLTLHARSEAQAEQAAKAAFARFAELEQIMSDYRPDSELMKLCDQAGKGPVKVSSDLWRVLARGQEIARLSGGAFDMTCGPVVRLWREARKTRQLPPASQLKEALGQVGFRKLNLNARERTAELLVPGMKLDLGGIAKGDACDQAMLVLKRHGIHRAKVEAGGDVVVSAPPPGKTAWAIAILGRDGEPLMLKECAISTSGDAYQYVEVEGKRYSHICDPRTGMGLTTRIQATVIAKDGLTSDPLTKGICVSGYDASRHILERFGAKAILVTGIPLSRI